MLTEWALDQHWASAPTSRPLEALSDLYTIKVFHLHPQAPKATDRRILFTSLSPDPHKCLAQWVGLKDEWIISKFCLSVIAPYSLYGLAHFSLFLSKSLEGIIHTWLTSFTIKVKIHMNAHTQSMILFPKSGSTTGPLCSAIWNLTAPPI